MPTTVRSLALGCGAIALMAMTGCSVGGAGETKTVTVEQPSSGGEASAPSPSPSPSAPSPDGAVAQAEGSIDGTRVRFIITELKRSGPTVVLNARVEPVTEADSPIAGQISETYSDGQEQQLPGGQEEEADVFDGVAIVDPRGRKKYLVARDSEGRCVCSNSLSGSFVAEAPVYLEATLSAPPPGVERVNVTIPGVKTFSDVPLAG